MTPASNKGGGRMRMYVLVLGILAVALLVGVVVINPIDMF